MNESRGWSVVAAMQQNLLVTSGMWEKPVRSVGTSLSRNLILIVTVCDEGTALDPTLYLQPTRGQTGE